MTRECCCAAADAGRYQRLRTPSLTGSPPDTGSGWSSSSVPPRARTGQRINGVNAMSFPMNVTGVTRSTAGPSNRPSLTSYDRIVAAVGAFGISESWLAQLAPGGRLVVPLRIVGSVSRSSAFERAQGGRWHSVDHLM